MIWFIVGLIVGAVAMDIYHDLEKKRWRDL